MKLDFIVDLQFGSTGKGLFAGYLALKNPYDTVFTAWGPNAGHTYRSKMIPPMVHTMLANSVVSPDIKRVMIGPGSVINPENLLAEIKGAKARSYLGGVSILVHPFAAVVTAEDREAESRYGFAIGSTMKGTAEAVIRKMRRKSTSAVAIDLCYRADPGPVWTELLEHLVVLPNAQAWNRMVDVVKWGLVEGAQGYSLGINCGMYPYTTSRDCTVAQLLVDCGLPIIVNQVYGVCRTFPIRVANRFDSNTGEQIGWSGPCYPDQEETSWEAIGIPTELTTVTKLPRRVFTFSEIQIREAVRTNQVNKVFLNFCNYIKDGRKLDLILDAIRNHTDVEWLGYGPNHEDIT